MPVRDLLMSAGGAGTTPLYVDDVFSTYCYIANGGTQTITNNIDLTKGGMVWVKDRTSATYNNLADTVQGISKKLQSSRTNAQQSSPGYGITNFGSSGFTVVDDSVGDYSYNGPTNDAFVSWTFRKAPKFFDIVQYTGTGSAHAINHSLGSTPGCIIVKDTSNANAWSVYHKGLNGGTTPEQYYAVLNTTAAQVASSALWNNTAPTSTQFTVGTDTTVNASGHTYIAYIFADQAGGFGATGTDSAVACGVATTDASGNLNPVNLGWEPQFVILKDTNNAQGWYILDVMRRMSQTGLEYMYTNTTSAGTQANGSPYLTPTATGFYGVPGLFNSSTNLIYIAIRRPNKPPTTGTSVYYPTAVTPTAGINIPTGFVTDLIVSVENNQTSQSGIYWDDRLRGSQQTASYFLQTAGPSGGAITEGTNTTGMNLANNTGYNDYLMKGVGISDATTYWNFKRSPTFFDEVCYAGNGTAGTTINHNLTVAPEMMIVKARSNSSGWAVYHKGLNGGTTPQNYTILLNFANAQLATSLYWNNTAPTSSVFTVGNGSYVNASTITYVAYLFATCAGVSKVGSFTGTGGTQSIACGFGSGGARFILIKRTDSSGSWYVFDSANGLTSSSSPYLQWNGTSGQTTGYNGIYASSGGFTLDSTASATVNISGGSYIFLAVA